MSEYRVACNDCSFEEEFDERYIAAAERDTHADKMEYFEGEAHDVNYEAIGDA